MRALLFAAACIAASACAPRAQPYRFSMSMLGGADVPPAALPGPTRKQPAAAPRTTQPRTHYAYGWQTDTQAGIRTASAKGIELSMPEASAASADAVPRDAASNGVVYSRLPTPHKVPTTGLVAALDVQGWDHIREAVDLRRWVGRRDKREPLTILLAWVADLELGDEALAAAGYEHEVVAWATQHSRLLGPTEVAQPGDLLVFDRAVANEPADLIAIVIGRDTRGVTEIAYAAGGVIRRGFVDAAHPTSRRDLQGGVLNTFLRHGKQWPPKGTRYLAGELLANVIRLR
jgi:hypothetical protein